MKLLVFSDSHRSMRGMRDALDLERPDYVIHLGDLEQDAQFLAQEYPSLAIAAVPGNCDGWPTQPLQKLLTYGQVRILLSHGHIWNVKRGYSGAIAAGQKSGAHIVLFGHTHSPYCQQQEDGLWVMNPGSIRDNGSYGVISIENGGFSCYLKRI